jgi:glycerol-3-phosphate O-acyltransferase / dihydroxyacetone phosphate acyltransferase
MKGNSNHTLELIFLLNFSKSRAKRLLAAWRVLVGVWAPKRWDMPVAALSQYTTPVIPPESAILQKYKKTEAEPAPSVVPASDESKDRRNRRRKAPSRKIIRHVLRARAEAVKALVSFFAQLEKGSEEPRVRSSIHLAELYGRDQEGRRYAREVVQFLRHRGARIVGLENSINVEGEWLANPVSSDWEGETSDAGAVRDDDVIWVPSSPLGDQ